jgi:hypothetical protein
LGLVASTLTTTPPRRLFNDIWIAIKCLQL